MIFVSSHISKVELLDLKNDLSILFPKYTLTDIETPDIKFQVVSIQEYPMISKSNVPILTPISIHQMKDNKINTNRFTLPQHGFINLHLFQRKISFSGFGSSKQKLIDMSYRMGAIVERRVSSKTSLLVSKTLRSNKAQAALKFGIPVVQDIFIYELFQSPILLDESNYFLKLFSGLVFTSSSLKNKEEKEAIMKYIIDNGGTFQGGLYSKTSFVISKPNAISIKLKEALDMKKTIIVDDLKDFYPTPQSLKKDTYPLLLPSELFVNLSFYISPKLENLYQNIFMELKILIQQHSGSIVNSVESANYIIQMDTEKDNRIEKESQNHGDKRRISLNENSSSISNPTYSSMSNNTPKMIPRTPIWVERCVEEGRILPSSDFYLFTPTKRSKRNGNFYVSLTGFDGHDYLNLISTLKWLDIRYCTRFRKSMTHLIAKNGHSSKKTKAATEWDIPIVGVDWLFSIAEGNLTNEALSNPWSPKRSQKVGTGISTSKNTINLDISDDDLDIEIIDQKTVNSSQNNSNGKNNNQKSKLNSPLLKSGSSSQRLLQSPKRISSITTDSKNTNTNAKSQSKPITSFLDDDDDDFPEFLYEDIIAHKITPKTAPSDKDIVISDKNTEKQNKNLDNSVSLINSSPRKMQSQSQASPKPIRLNQSNKKTINYLSSDFDDESLDILYEISQKNTVPLSRNQSSNDLSNNKKVDTNIQPTNSFNSFQNNSTDIKNDSKPFLQTKSNSSVTAPITPINSINIERSKSDKLITPPSAIDHHNPKNNQNQNLFELSTRQPSPPPPPSIHQIQRKTNELNDLNTKGIMKTEIKTPPAQTNNQKIVTIIADEPHNVQQKQDKKPVLKFLDDDDDDDVCDLTEYEKPKKKVSNIADAANNILKMVNRKRRTKKNNNSKSKNNENKTGLSHSKYSFDEENSDSQYELLESFTQKPVDNDNNLLPIISYEDTDEPSKETVITDDDEDPLFKLLQTKKGNT